MKGHKSGTTGTLAVALASLDFNYLWFSFLCTIFLARAAKLPVTLILVTVTGKVTVTLVTMTEIAEDQVCVHIPVIYF
jgi:hypothetical protein